MNGDVLQLTVSQFTDRFKGWIRKRPELARIAIVGEVSELKPQQNGNAYFKLRDERAVLQCFAFSSVARSFADLKNGDQVVATGEIGLWERSSQYQLLVSAIAPIGVGAMTAKIEQLRKRLEAEGLFRIARKRAIVELPNRVALVSARDGEGAADFIATLREKAPNVKVIAFETRVQGEGAEIDIADAIDRAGRANVDAIVVLRGGGSEQDLYPFNTEPVVRAIVRAARPVVTAIGHTRNYHLADEAADAVFKTPTAAAEHIARSWWEATSALTAHVKALRRAVGLIVANASQRVDYVRGELEVVVERRVAAANKRLSNLRYRLEQVNPQQRLAERRTRLARLTGGLRGWPGRALPAWSHALQSRSERIAAQRARLMPRFEERLSRAVALLNAADPHKPLERGYAIVSVRGRALTRARDVFPSDEIVATLYRGSLTARVETVSGDE